MNPVDAHSTHEPALRVRGLTVDYRDVRALDDVDLALRSGRVHGLLGTNGSGKSTLFKSLLGLVRATAGEVELVGSTSAVARRSGMVAYAPQSEDVDWDFPVSVRDVVTMGRFGQMGWFRRASARDRRAVDEALERVDLVDLASRRIGALSGGQRKRAFVARGLAQGARLLLLDEPFAGVDKRSEALITDLLRELAAEGRTVLVSTHDLVAVPELCDTVTLVNRSIVASGPVGDVLVPELVAEAFGGFVPHSMLAGEGARGRSAGSHV